MNVDSFCCLTQKCIFMCFGSINIDDQICFITQKKICDVKHVAVADDGFKYDAFALQRWLIDCKKRGNEMCIIPSLHIKHVFSTRSTCLHIIEFVLRALKQK